jgi:hypothetical protein
MCFHSKQTKLALEVKNRFNPTIDNPIEFTPNAHMNGFEYFNAPVIIDKKQSIITHYN